MAAGDPALGEPRSEAQWLALIEERRAGVKAVLRKSSTNASGEGNSQLYADALRLALTEPPFQCGSAVVKEANALVVFTAALAVNEADLGNVLALLTAEEAECLLKYAYRALAKPSDKAASWLRWHAALVEKTGPGAIVRVIAEVDRTA